MHRLLAIALLGAALLASPAVTSAAEPTPLVLPTPCQGDSSDLEACRVALSKLLQAEPDNHLARLRLADTNFHLDDDASAALDIEAVRSRVGPEQFAVLLAAQKDFISIGPPDCRLYQHVSNHEVAWRGPCVSGLADGTGLLTTFDNKRAYAQIMVVRAGLIRERRETWGVEQDFPSGVQYWRFTEGERLRLVKPDTVPSSVAPFLTEAAALLPERLVRSSRIDTIKAGHRQLASGWLYHCWSFNTRPGERFHLSLKTPGRQAWIAIQPARECNAATWSEAAGKRAAGGGDTVELDVTAAGGVYAVAMSGAGQPGPYTYTREQLPGTGAATLPPGGVPIPPWPNGTASTATFKSARTYQTGETIQDCPTCPQMVVVPAGAFMMGSPATEEGRQGAEGPRRQVTFKRAFAVGKFEVTFDEWNACVTDGGCTYKPADNGWGQGRRPVINLGWTDVREYLAWLTKTSGYYYYLPSEAEWEYAARAGADTPWNTGDGIITDDANILNAFGRTVPVGGFPANAFGLHDMHGNVAEWVQDCFEVGYFDVPNDGGAKLAASCTGIARGGTYRDEPAAVRSAARWAAGNLRDPGVGFRVVRLLD